MILDYLSRTMEHKCPFLRKAVVDREALSQMARCTSVLKVGTDLPREAPEGPALPTVCPSCKTHVRFLTSRNQDNCFC